MRFIKAQEAEPGDQVVIMGHPYQVRMVKEVTHDDPLPAPPWEDDGGRVQVPRYTLWFTDGSASDEVGFPQFLLVKRENPTASIDTVRERMVHFSGNLRMHDTYDCSSLMLQGMAESACKLRDALDEYFCLSTACGIRPQ